MVFTEAMNTGEQWQQYTSAFSSSQLPCRAVAPCEGGSTSSFRFPLSAFRFQDFSF
jgi:hypothetical protein